MNDRDHPSAGELVVPAVTPNALTYEKLATWYDRKGQAQQRDRFLVLAADAAQSAGNAEEAETLRLQLLRHNPHHLLRPFTSFGQAMNSADVQSYVNDLRNSYPPKKAAEILASLGPLPAGKPSQAAPIPPTQPVVDLDAHGLASPSIPAKEPLKVYRVGDEAPAAGKPVSAGDRPRPGAAAPHPQKHAAPVRAKPAPIYSLAPEPSPRPHHNEQRRLEPASEPLSGAWLGTVLFVVVLAASLALGVYTLAGPAILTMR